MAATSLCARQGPLGQRYALAGQAVQTVRSLSPRSGPSARGRYLHRNRATDAIEALDGRRTLHASSIGLVEDISTAADSSAPVGYTSHCRIALTYFGAARWQLGRQELHVDSNSAIILKADQEFSDWQLGKRVGRAAVTLTPDPMILEELQSRGASHLIETSGAVPISVRLSMLTHQLLAAGAGDATTALAKDELTLAALAELFAAQPPRRPARALQIVGRAKALLHDRINVPIRLDEFAAELGVSPVYLTQVFCATEGLPLYRYQMRLRINRALVELPDCEDITALALKLGFSSHSHFGATFRAITGLTPSAFRRRGLFADVPTLSRAA